MTANEIDAVELMSQFQRLEFEGGLFQEIVAGKPWWDSVRFEVYSFLEQELIERTSTRSRPQWKQLASAVRHHVMRRRLYKELSQQKGGVLFFRAPRARQGDKLIDKVVDPIIELFPNEGRWIDTFPRRYHVPDVREPASYRGICFPPRNLPTRICDKLETFGTSFELSKVQVKALERTIQFRLYSFEIEVAAYGRLFDVAGPDQVVLVQNGIEKALFRAAAERGIPTIEAQHGLINFSHSAYSYNPKISYKDQTTFPDVFLTFSEHWKSICHFPATRSVAVGSDSFNLHPVSTAPILAIMFVSSSIHHTTLASWVRRISKILKSRRIIYKLHPNQMPDFDQITKEFCDLPNVEIATGYTPASMLMNEVSHVVSICSTVVYEALQAARLVAIIPKMNYRCHKDLLDLSLVDVVHSPEDLIQFSNKPCSLRPSIRFFDQFDGGKVREVLREFLSPSPAR